MRKVKRFIRKLLPAAASVVIGATLSPAAGLVASTIVSRLSTAGISIDPSEVEELTSSMLKDPSGIGQVISLLTDKAKAENEYGENTIRASVEYAVRDVMRELRSSIEELRQRQDLLLASIEQMQMISNAESAEALNKIFQGLVETPHMGASSVIDHSTGATISDSTVSYISRIEALLTKLDFMEHKLDELQERSYQQLSEDLNPMNIHIASLTQVLLAETSSRYDIKYDPEIYVPRSSVEYSFTSLLDGMNKRKPKNLFIVLADVGMGKTWTLANIARRYSIEGYPTFFIPLRMGLKDQLEYIFNSEFFKVFDRIQKYYEITNKPVILILDGLDEVQSSERAEIMRFVASLKAKKEVIVILSCRITDWEIDPYISDYLSSIHKNVFGNTSKGNPYSVLLTEFNEEEFFNALERYNLPYFEGSLNKLAKKPFFMRIVADFYSENGRLPNPDNIEEFLNIIADPNSLSVFTRIGLRGYSRTKLLTLVEHMLSEGKSSISDDEFLKIMDDRNIRSRLISSGLLIQEETKYGVNIKLNDIYGFYLAILSLRRLTHDDLAKILNNAVKVYPKLNEVFASEMPIDSYPEIQNAEYRLNIQIGRNEYSLDVSDGTIAIFRNPMSGTINVVVNGKIYDIGMSDRTLSRNKHALLNIDSGNITITDLDSTNGIYIGNKRLTPNKPYKIRLNSEVRLGLKTVISLSLKH